MKSDLADFVNNHNNYISSVEIFVNNQSWILRIRRPNNVQNFTINTRFNSSAIYNLPNILILTMTTNILNGRVTNDSIIIYQVFHYDFATFHILVTRVFSSDKLMVKFSFLFYKKCYHFYSIKRSSSSFHGEKKKR